MKRSILSPLALGIVLAGALAAYPAVGAMKPAHGHSTIHHRYVAAHATALAPQSAFPAATPSPHPYNTRETDGLSRNPDDCALYGCIDNGGA